MDTLLTNILSEVQSQYELFPYPNYPLLAKPQWQDGYLTSSKFSARLLTDLKGVEASINRPRGQFVRNNRAILIAGSGEILPYIIRKNEPAAHRLLCVDLSQHNLRRARFRLMTSLAPTQFIRADIDQFLIKQGAVTGPFDHIDVYGVLHHLSDPKNSLRLMSQHLSPGGTMRVMVYNSNARKWIKQFQKVFALLKLNYKNSADLKIARELIQKAKSQSPHLAWRMSGMGESTLGNDSRFIDTFFHRREARISLQRWFEIFKANELTPLGLLDRYGELDDLENPLWKMPQVADLEARSKNLNFENNLEIFLYKSSRHMTSRKNPYSYERRPDFQDVWHLYFKRPPELWFSFPETKQLSWQTRRRLWHSHFSSTYGTESSVKSRNFLKKIPLPALQRLARLGVIFPSQIADPVFQAEIAAPMESGQSEHEQNNTLDKANFERTSMADYCMGLLQAKGILTSKRLNLILARLNESQMIIKPTI